MGFLNSLFGRKSDPKEYISQFYESIQLQKDHLFGLSLYFHGVELMYSDQPEIIEMNRKSFDNIGERTEESIRKAESLLIEVKKNPSKSNKLNRFKFPPTIGHIMFLNLHTL